MRWTLGSYVIGISIADSKWGCIGIYILIITWHIVILVLRTTAIWGNDKQIAVLLSSLLASTFVVAGFFANNFLQSLTGTFSLYLVCIGANGITDIPSPTSAIPGCLITASNNILYVCY